MDEAFLKEWRIKVKRVRSSKYWHQITAPPKPDFVIDPTPPKKNEVRIDDNWTVFSNVKFASDSPAGIGIRDLKQILKSNFKLKLKTHTDPKAGPYIKFVLKPKESSRWETGFRLNVGKDKLLVTAPSEQAILHASLYLTNFWRLRRSTTIEQRSWTVKPGVNIHVGADFWGGFCTTHAWVDGRQTDSNYIELARMGINAMPIMICLDDYIDEAPKSFRSLINPQAKINRERLAQLARQSSKYGVYIFLMAYNPRLSPDHPLFKDVPGSAGAMQNGIFQPLCTSHTQTRKFLTKSWASLFKDIPELGGLLAIVGGEGFNHCFMRSDESNAADCPRCGKRNGSEVVAEFVNETAQAVRGRNPQAKVIAWPYSAGHWSNDRDQIDFINRLDRENVIFQTEIEKDFVDWRPAGYAKYCWDYSAGCVKVSDRCRNQRNICKKKKIEFSCKTQINNSIECFSVPYLPSHFNHLKVWQNSVAMKPTAIHSRWLFDGASKSISEELGYWAIWKSPFTKKGLEHILHLMAERDFGKRAAKHVLKAWHFFSEAMKHHPSLDYYIASYYIGPGQPLVLYPDDHDTNLGWQVYRLKLDLDSPQKLDKVFYASLYIEGELHCGVDNSSLLEVRKLFYDQPAFKAIARRGAKAGQDVALDELKLMAKLWDKGVEALRTAEKFVPRECRAKFRQEFILARHLGYTWQSAANVEEFLRLRNIITDHSGAYAERSGYVRENIRDLKHMEKIAIDELQIAKEELKLIRGVDFLDLSLRLDIETASLESIMQAKIKQVTSLLKNELPQWEKQLLTW